MDNRLFNISYSKSVTKTLGGFVGGGGGGFHLVWCFVLCWELHTGPSH